MKNKSLFVSGIIVLVVLIAFVRPSISYASWWNPASWFNNWSFGDKAVLDSKQDFSQSQVTETNYLSPVIPVNISSPSYDNVLESGKKITVIFKSIKNAVKYEINITNGEKNIHVPTSEDIGNIKTDINVPPTKGMYLSENSHDVTDELIINAFDKNDRVIGIGKKQIRILPSPNQPNLLKADKYVADGNGDTITLTFGVLPKKFVRREVDITCVNSYTLASIDNEPCGKNITLGTGQYTKKLSIKRNIFNDRETAVIVGVRYYDSNNQEENPSGIDDESFVSIKLNKPTAVQGSLTKDNQPAPSYVSQILKEEEDRMKNCPADGLKFFNNFVNKKGKVSKGTDFAFGKIVGEPQYHYNKLMPACLIKLTHTISESNDKLLVSVIRTVDDGALLIASFWDLDGKDYNVPNSISKKEFEAQALELMAK